MELVDAIAVSEEMLQPHQFLDVVEVLEAIIVDLEALYWVSGFEGIDIKLLYLVVVDVQLL